MNEKPKTDLTRGVSHFTTALQYANPELDPSEIELLGNTMLEEISDSIISGEQIASVRQKANGNFLLRILHIGKQEDE